MNSSGNGNKCRTFSYLRAGQGRECDVWRRRETNGSSLNSEEEVRQIVPAKEFSVGLDETLCYNT